MAKFLTLLCQSAEYDDFKGETLHVKALFHHALVNLEITNISEYLERYYMQHLATCQTCHCTHQMGEQMGSSISPT